MKRFIEIIDSNNNRRFLNINHIEEIAEKDENNCYIYMAFNVLDAIEQDYFLVNKPYNEIISLINDD